MIDVTKLTPAPWVVSPGRAGPDYDGYGESLIDTMCESVPDNRRSVIKTMFYDATLWLGCTEADTEFIALARNALDVMMRRKWWPIYENKMWRVDTGWKTDNFRVVAADPYTALVEADRWMTENRP